MDFLPNDFPTVGQLLRVFAWYQELRFLHLGKFAAQEFLAYGNSRELGWSGRGESESHASPRRAKESLRALACLPPVHHRSGGQGIRFVFLGGAVFNRGE